MLCQLQGWKRGRRSAGGGPARHRHRHRHRHRLKTAWQQRNRKIREVYNFSMNNDIQGIIMLEIHSAPDLPEINNGASHQHHRPD
jgi:hypothetical protein